MPVLKFTSRKTIVFDTKTCVARRLKPGNFEPQLLHWQLFTHEEFIVHSGKHLLFLGRWNLEFGATTSGLMFISPSWMTEKENQEGTAHSSATHSGAAWCWSASSWNMCFDGSMVCWQPDLQCSKFLLRVNSASEDIQAPLIPIRSSCTNTWKLNSPFSVSFDQHLYQPQLWNTSFSWNWAFAGGKLSFNNEKIKVSGVLSAVPTWRGKKICLF